MAGLGALAFITTTAVTKGEGVVLESEAPLIQIVGFPLIHHPLFSGGGGGGIVVVVRWPLAVVILATHRE